MKAYTPKIALASYVVAQYDGLYTRLLLAYDGKYRVFDTLGSAKGSAWKAENVLGVKWSPWMLKSVWDTQVSDYQKKLLKEAEEIAGAQQQLFTA